MVMVAFKGVLLDLGCVVNVGDEPLPGAIDAIGRLRDEGISVRFLTSTTWTSHRELIQKLRHRVPAIGEAELFTPALAARQLLEREGLAPHPLVHLALEGDLPGFPPLAEPQS